MIDLNNVSKKGEKHFAQERHEGGYSVKERAYGRFDRALPLGYEVDPENAEATYKHGVLHVEVNKSRHHKRRKIQVHWHMYLFSTLKESRLVVDQPWFC